MKLKRAILLPVQNHNLGLNRYFRNTVNICFFNAALKTQKLGLAASKKSVFSALYRVKIDKFQLKRLYLS